MTEVQVDSMNGIDFDENRIRKNATENFEIRFSAAAIPAVDNQTAPKPVQQWQNYRLFVTSGATIYFKYQKPTPMKKPLFFLLKMPDVIIEISHFVRSVV